MPFQQPPLPFDMNAMKPFLSEEQLKYHYGKHHAAYFKNLNGLVEGKPEAGMSLREVVVQSTGPGIQQRGPGLEPQLLLGLPVAAGRRRTPGRLGRGPPARLRQLCGVPEGHVRGGREAVRLGLGLAGRRPGGKA